MEKYVTTNIVKHVTVHKVGDVFPWWGLNDKVNFWGVEHITSLFPTICFPHTFGYALI